MGLFFKLKVLSTKWRDYGIFHNFIIPVIVIAEMNYETNAAAYSTGKSRC